jgi:hypothetical protein
MFARITLSLAAFAVVSVAFAADPKPADALPPQIKVGMRVKAEYAGSHYKATIKEIKDKYHYVIRAEGSKTDSNYEAWRLQTEDGVDFLDLIKDPKRMAARARDKMTGKDYFVGVWNTSNNPVWTTLKTEDLGNNRIRVTEEWNLKLVHGMVVIKPDGTYEHMMYGKEKTYTGKWSQVAPGGGDLKPKDGGVLLEKGHISGGDLLVTREPLGTIRLVDSKFGGAGYGGSIAPPKPADEKK